MNKVAALFAVLAIGSIAMAQDKVLLKRVAKPGETFKYSLVVDTELNGTPITYKATVQDKILEAKDDGSYKISTEQTNAKVVMDGNEMDTPTDVGALSTSTVEASGRIADMDGDMVSADAFRMATLEAIVWPKQEVGPGDKWQVKVEKNDRQGVVASVLDYELLGFEDFGSRKAVKLGYSSKELEGSDPAMAKGTIWVELGTGLTLKRESEWTNVPIAGFLISGKVKMSIID
ncbi:MAG: hypothetical protein KIT11_07570 [Fimbriimonadaceae bacterium]|nr:hypothetical protein [Fimbriimonadaceae bacterium]QYK56211.1 MAG: hypothetical protein KF733_01760 [Fimbriimonadaceae bacterium]